MVSAILCQPMSVPNDFHPNICHCRGLLTPAEVERVYNVLNKLHLPLIHEVVTPELLMKVRICW